MKKLFLVMLMIFVLPLSAFAEREKYIDKDFDFKKVKTVFYMPPIITANVSDIKANEIDDTYYDAFIKLKNVKIITPRMIMSIIEEKADVDLTKVQYQDAYWMIADEACNHADVIIFSHIYSYGTGSTRVGEVKYKLPSTTTSTVSTPYGTAHVQTQGLETYSIPEHDALTLYAGVRFDVVDTKNVERPVMSIIDSRGKVAEVFGSQNPDKMYKRILSNFFDEINELLAK